MLSERWRPALALGEVVQKGDARDLQPERPDLASAYRPRQFFPLPIIVLTLARSRTPRFSSHPPPPSCSRRKLTVSPTVSRGTTHNLDVDAERGPPLEPGRIPPRALCWVTPGEFLSVLHRPWNKHKMAGEEHEIRVVSPQI